MPVIQRRKKIGRVLRRKKLIFPYRPKNILKKVDQGPKPKNQFCLPMNQVLKNQQILNQFIETTKDTLYNIEFRCAPLGTTNKCAVIVEPRDHPHLEYVIRNVSYFLGDEWSVLLMHGIQNTNASEILGSKLPNMGLLKLPVNDLKPTSNPGYNELLTSVSFYNSIPAETILIFQTDSILLRKGIDEFLEFDYVGAPWCFGGMGNGGLSLRKKSKMIEIILKTPYATSGTGAEDVYFSTLAKRTPNTKLPTIQKAMAFSVETMYHPSPLGVHDFYCYMPEPQMRSLLNTLKYT